MRGRRVASAVLVVIALVSPGGCGDDERQADLTPYDGGPGSDVAIVEASSPEDIDASAGALELVDVADTPCGAAAGTPAAIFNAAANVTPLALVNVGARRAGIVSNGIVEDGLTFMDSNGANPSGSIVNASFPVSAISSNGTALFAVGRDDDALKGAWFDAQGASLGQGVLISTNATGIAAGGDNGHYLAAWLEGADLRAAGFNAQNAASGPAFDFRRGLVEKANASLAIAHQKDDRFGVAHSSDGAGNYRLTFTLVSTVARIGTSYTITAGATATRVVGVAHTAKGFAILVELGLPATPVIVFVDDTGKIAGPGRRLLGAQRAYGIASSGGELGVLVHRFRTKGEDTEPDAPEFRPFDASGEPLAPWVCLDSPATTFDFDMGAAIAAEANGYAALMRDNTKQVVLRRFDRRGASQ